MPPEIVIPIRADTSPATKALSNFNPAGIIKKGMLGVVAAAAAAGAAAGAGIIKGLSIHKEVEKELAKVAALFPGLSEDIEKKWDDDVKRLALKTGRQFKEITTSMYQAASSGLVESDDLADFIENNITTFALAASISMDQAATAIVQVKGALRNTAHELENIKIGEYLKRTEQLYLTTFDELLAVTDKLATASKILNIPFNESLALYGELRRRGVSYGSAIAQITRVSESLSISTGKTAEIIEKELGKSFAELQADGHNVVSVLNLLVDEGVKMEDVFTTVQARQGALNLRYRLLPELSDQTHPCLLYTSPSPRD